MQSHAEELAEGRRYEFGRNWRRFLAALDEERIRAAQASLEALCGTSLAGRRFLDVGCGSGLFSLAARRLGARVHSFDFDPQCVACAAELKARFLPGDADWTIEDGSILDASYVRSLGPFDVVYAWGVLHHTGDLWRALEHAQGCVAPGGLLAVAIYNDQGWRSRLWLAVKRAYCAGPLRRAAVLAAFVPCFALAAVAKGLLKTGLPWGYFRDYKRKRGMSLVTDWLDWLGGLPYQVAEPAAVIDHCRRHGLELRKLVATRRSGNNEFLFQRPP